VTEVENKQKTTSQRYGSGRNFSRFDAAKLETANDVDDESCQCRRVFFFSGATGTEGCEVIKIRIRGPVGPFGVVPMRRVPIGRFPSGRGFLDAGPMGCRCYCC
jgi:hypothetical protein